MLEQTGDPLLDRLDGTVRWAYEIVMIGLAVVVVVLLGLPDEGVVRVVNLTVWAIFVVDYAVRLALAEDRRNFVRSNIPDLIAILPLDFFRAARALRLARLVRLVRAGTVIWRVSADFRGVMRTNGLQWVLAVASGTIVLGGAIVWLVDPAIETLGDAIWWAVVTSTTVGYGDLAPVDPVSRGVAVAIMIVGVGTIGMLTGSIATYFTRRRATENAHVEFIQQRLEQWDGLDDTDRQEVAAMLTALATTSEPTARREQTSLEAAG